MNASPRAGVVRLLVLLCILVLAVPYPVAAQPSDTDSSPAWSEPAPLAAQSLLLDADETDGRIIAVGERGHVLVSGDGGGSWTQARVPARSMLTAVTAVGSQVWAVGHDAVIVHSADAGATWSRRYYAPEKDAPLLDVWIGDGGRGLAVGAYGLALKTSDGEHWKEVTVTADEDHLNAIAATADGTVYIAAENGGVFRSRDGGVTWDAKPTSYTGSLFGALAASDAVLVFGLRGHVFRSEDAGESWARIDTGTDATLQSGAQLEDGTLLIVGLSGTVLVSRDGGRHFSGDHRPDRRGLSAALPLSGDGFLLFGEHGVHRLGRDVLGGAT